LSFRVAAHYFCGKRRHDPFFIRPTVRFWNDAPSGGFEFVHNGKISALYVVVARMSFENGKRPQRLLTCRIGKVVNADGGAAARAQLFGKDHDRLFRVA
jgi:hypothetical protein